MANERTASDILKERNPSPFSGDSLSDNIRSKLTSGTEVTQNEMDYLDAFDLHKEKESGVVLSPDEESHLAGFSDMIGLVGTRFETDLPGSLTEGMLGEFRRSQLPSMDDLARAEGASDGAGLLDDKTQKNFFKALSETQSGISGDIDFSGVLDKFQRLQAETALERDIIKSEHKEPYEQSKLASEITTSFIGGGAAQNAATKAFTKIPKMVSNSVLAGSGSAGLGRSAIVGAEAVGGKIGSEIGGAVIGAAATEALLDPDAIVAGDMSKVRDAGLTGAVLQGVLQRMSRLGRPVGDAMGKLIKDVEESVRDTAGVLARRFISPIKKPLQRGLARQGITDAQLGREVILADAVPRLSRFRIEDYVDLKLEASRLGIGKKIGDFRDEADEFAVKFMEKTNLDFDKAVKNSRGELTAGTELVGELEENLRHFESEMFVDMDRVSRNIRKIVAEQDPADNVSVPFKVNRALSSWADHLDELPDKKRTIDEAVKLKRKFIMDLNKQGQGVFTESQTVQVSNAAEEILSDITNQVTIRNLKLKKMLGDDFNQGDIEAAFGSLSRDLSRAVKKTGLTPDDVQDILSIQSTMGDLNRRYRIIKNAQQMFADKKVSDASNKIIGLSEYIAAATMFGGSSASGIGDKTEMAVAGAVLSKLLKHKGLPAASGGMTWLANRVNNLGVAVGSIAANTNLLAEMPGLTPAIYAALVGTDSPMQIHNFMVINDPANLEIFKEGVSDSDSLSSVQKANMISEINKKGEVRLFYKGAKGEDEVHTTKGLTDFKDRLNGLAPRVDTMPQIEAASQESFDFSQSPLFGKKKVTEDREKIEPGNLPMNKQIQGFLDTVMGTTQIGLDPQETFPEGQITEQELADMQAAASLPIPGKLIKVNFGKGRGRGIEGSSQAEIDALIPEIKGLSDAAKNALRVMNKDSGIDPDELFQIKNAVNRSSLNSETRESIARLNSKGVKGDPYQGRDFGSVVWNPNTEGLKKFDMPIPVYKADLRDGILGHKVSQGGADPFMWMDHRWKVTQKFLKKHGEKIKTINTRSDLIAQDDYMAMLPKGATINMYVGPSNLRDIASKRIEPGNPSLKRRLAAAEKLEKAGFKVNIVVDFFKGKNQKLIKFLNDPEDSNLKKRLFSVKENTVELTDAMEKSLVKILGDFK